MKNRAISLFVMLFSMLVMELLRKAGYLQSVSLFWRCVLAGTLAGVFYYGARYFVKAKSASGRTS